jgi:hypothetical protein
MRLLEKKRGLRSIHLSVSLAALILTAPAIGSAQESLSFPPTPSGSKSACNGKIAEGTVKFLQ